MVLVFSFTNACTNSGEPMGTPTQIIPSTCTTSLEASSRTVRMSLRLWSAPFACIRLSTSSRASAQGQTLDIDLALGEADVQSGVLLEGGLELSKNRKAIKEGCAKEAVVRKS